MPERYDVIVVGAGHNGLVAGSYLAKAGRNVVVVERSGAPGGLARSDYLIPEAPNHMINHGAIELIHVRASPILRELELAKHGWRTVETEPSYAYLAPDGAHPLAGRRAPDLPLTDGRRLYEALRTRRFVLVAPETEPVSDSVAGGWAGRVECATLAGPTRMTVLVRPDAHIAWATDERDAERRAAAVWRALTGWCGAPAGSTTPQPATGRP